MEALEVSAKTVEEAIQIALEKLGLSRSEVEVEVLQEGKPGILGFGGEEARVKVTPLVPPKEKEEEEAKPPEKAAETAELAKEVAEKLLFLMKIPASVKVSGGEDEKSPLTLNIEDEDKDLGILIGRRGRTLLALQYMVNFIVSRKLKSKVRVTVDVAEYRKRRQEELRELALRVADLVKSTRRSITLEPMAPWERRIIHLTLRGEPNVETQSIGFGENRKVVIYPRRRGQTK